MKNFAKLKDSIYAEVINSLKENRPKAKKLIKGYVTILKNNPTLQEAFHIHGNLERGSFKNDEVKHGFIIENLNAIKRLNKEELRVGLEQLNTFIKQNKISYTTDLDLLSEKISNLMFNINKTNKSIENNQAIEYIVETVGNRQVTGEQRKPVSHKIFKQTATKHYNDKFAGMSESEKKIVKAFFSGDQKQINEHYNQIVMEIKKTIENRIQITDDRDIKLKLYEVKDKLYSVPETITLEHFNKILQLKEKLGE